MMATYITKSALAFLFFKVVVSAASPGNNTIANANNTSIGTTINTFLNISGDIVFSFIRIVLGVLILVLLLMLIRWIKRDDYEILIMPFEIVKSQDKYNGIAISELLIAELQRIKQINNTKYVGIENEKLDVPPQILNGEKASIPQLGTVGTGSASISLGEMMITIKQLIRGGNRGQIITGSLEDCGSKIKLVACLRGDKSCTWEVETQIGKKVQSNSIDEFDISTNENEVDNFISDPIRDLSFKIAYNLSQDRISAKTLLGFKYYTEALASYQQYMITHETNYLNLASESGVKAIDIEQDYAKTFGLFFNLGVAYYNEKMYDKTDNMFSKALKQNPESADAWNNKGVALYEQGKFYEAVKAYDEAIRLNPNSVNAWSNKGIALSSLKKYDGAIKAYDEATRLNPNSVKTWYNKGIALYEQGKFYEAIKAYDEAVKLNPNYVDAWNNKGVALNSLKKYDEAIKACDEAIKLDPNSVNAWSNKGIALSSLKKSDEAFKCFDEAIRLSPNLAAPWGNKGIALQKLGRTAEANAAFAKAKELGYMG
jgi:tetratricopeptide (TPR) repeat protein